MDKREKITEEEAKHRESQKKSVEHGKIMFTIEKSLYNRKTISWRNKKRSSPEKSSLARGVHF
jgi:hypothetical protein